MRIVFYAWFTVGKVTPKTHTNTKCLVNRFGARKHRRLADGLDQKNHLHLEASGLLRRNFPNEFSDIKMEGPEIG